MRVATCSEYDKLTSVKGGVSWQLSILIHWLFHQLAQPFVIMSLNSLIVGCVSKLITIVSYCASPLLFVSIVSLIFLKL